MPFITYNWKFPFVYHARSHVLFYYNQMRSCDFPVLSHLNFSKIELIQMHCQCAESIRQLQYKCEKERTGCDLLTELT